MTYEDCVNFFKIKALAASPDCTFVSGKKADSSLISVDTVWPLIWLAPFTETIDRRKGNIDRQVAIAFFTQDSTNNTLDERKALFESMWQLKEAFMNSIENSIPMPGQISNERSTMEFQMLSGYASGYAVSFKFSSKLPC